MTYLGTLFNPTETRYLPLAAASRNTQKNSHQGKGILKRPNVVLPARVRVSEQSKQYRIGGAAYLEKTAEWGFVIAFCEHVSLGPKGHIALNQAMNSKRAHTRSRKSS